MKYALSQIDRIAEEGNLATYRVIVRIDANSVIAQPGVLVSQHIGSVNLVDIVILAHIGDRWYLTSPYCLEGTPTANT